MTKIKNKSLYLVITENCGKGRTSCQITEAAIKGGVDIVQIREKDKARPELVKLGKELSRLCRKNKVVFIVNDDPVLAKEVDADGVHLGQEDFKNCPIAEVRRIIGKDRIIGISTHSQEQFDEANEMDVDYIAFGPVFKTKTKDYFIGTDALTGVLKIAQKPIFAIGGINLSNIDELLGQGVRNIAMIRAITEAPDITARTKEFKERIARW